MGRDGGTATDPEPIGEPNIAYWFPTANFIGQYDNVGNALIDAGAADNRRGCGVVIATLGPCLADLAWRWFPTRLYTTGRFCPRSSRSLFSNKLTGGFYDFLTNEMTIPPGLFARLYQMRWGIEKVYDEVKNNCDDKRAWASSPTAKTMQATLICLRTI